MRRAKLAVVLAVCAAVLAGPARLRAEDKPDKDMHKAFDTAVYNVLKDVINRGADIYNPPTSDWNGCYRFYEGALTVLKPLLHHRPELQKAIDAGLQKAQPHAAPPNRAFHLRHDIDKIHD